MSARKIRYNTSGKWLKGNTHIHSIASDGGKDFAELAAMYSSAGYDFLFRTDHWVASRIHEDDSDYPLTWLDGVELDGRDSAGTYYHVVCLGKVDSLPRQDGLDACLRAARNQGALLILAHPHWSGNMPGDWAPHRFDGVEVYNHVCRWLNGKSEGLVHWEFALRRNPDTLAFSVDDAHIRPEHPGWNGGWIMANVSGNSSFEILNSIRRGNYYSSCGPEIYSIAYDSGMVNIETSPIQFARLAGPGPQGARIGSFDGKTFTRASLKCPDSWEFAYIEIEDTIGRRAWTNQLFTEDERLDG